jgi:acyl carrier protein
VELEKIIREFLMEEFGDQGFHEGIRDNESLIEADVIDSLGILTIISFLEEKFGILSGEDELAPPNFESINAISKFVKKKLGRKKLKSLL